MAPRKRIVTKSKQQMIEEFNNTKKNVTYVVEDNKKCMTRGFDKMHKRGDNRSRRAVTNHYDKYKNKLDRDDIANFNSRDVLYYFQDLAKASGYKYVIANFPAEMSKINNLIKKGYSVIDIVSMMDFLFTSGQTYLELKYLTPNILATGWCNRIYSDTQDWLQHNYDPHKTSKATKTKSKRLREWEDDEDDEW